MIVHAEMNMSHGNREPSMKQTIDFSLDIHRATKYRAINHHF